MMDKWQIVHNFRRCVEEGHAAPLLCPEDENILHASPDKDGEPVFKCYYCGTVYNPGLKIWDQITAIVKEWYL